jgi:dipeptidyl aminopeptidase/acylaminoacyl peptidase
MSSLKIEDFYDLRFLANLNVANGRIFFEVFRPVEKTNKYESEIFELKGTNVVRYTRGNEDRDSVVDITGFLMAYLIREDKKTAVLIKDIETGEENKIWETDLKVKKMAWDRLSKGLYLIVQDKPKDKDFRVIEKYPIYFNGEGFFPSINHKFIHLGLRGKVQTILEGDAEIIDFAINSSGPDIAIVERPEKWDVYDSRIGVLLPGTEEIDYIKGAKGGISSPVYDHDGKLYFLLNRHEKSIFESPKIYCYDGGRLENLLESYDITPENTMNSDSRMGNTKTIIPHEGFLYFVATVQGRSGIYKIGANKKLESVVSGDFTIDSFDFNEDVIYYIGQSSVLPQEIYRYGERSQRLTTINSKLERRTLKKARNFSMIASDGEEVEGWLLKGQKKATVLEIHGGPRTSFGEAFSFEFHLLNSRGFNVIYANPRGSDSYGDNFALEIKERFGERDYQDLMEVVDYSSDKLGINPSNIGVIGGSYGGFMVNWMIGHTNLFKAAVTDRSISDQISFYFSSDIGPRFNSDQMGGTPYDNLQHFWDKSPIKFIKNVKTPLLIIHSEEDYRCPVWQAYELFTQLKRQGSEVRMVIFKEENHDLSRGGKPKDRIKRLEEILDWFETKLD